MADENPWHEEILEQENGRPNAETTDVSNGNILGESNIII
jgi:hypothetical protein